MTKFAKLYWQCRRGTQELDLLLIRYLESQFELADKNEQASFIELLALEDDVLIGLLLNNVGVESIPMKALLRKMYTLRLT
jgi:antitoxin CptB